MDTVWILVWMVVFPPAGPNKDITWESHSQPDMTYAQCFDLLAEKDQEFRMRADKGEVLGHEIYCRDIRGKLISVEKT